MSVHSGETTKDGKKWYFTCYYKDYKGITKQYKSKKYLTRKEAEKNELLFKTKNENPSYIKFEVIILDYIDYLYKTKKESTAFDYSNVIKKHITPYFGDFYINDINTLEINKWKATVLKNNYKRNYNNKLYTILNNIFIFAIRNYSIKENPVSLVGSFEMVQDDIVKDEDKLRYITLEQFNKLISVIEELDHKVLFITLFYTGLRFGELQALTWNDIDFDNNEIIVNKTLSTKTSKDYKITTTKNYINRKIKMSRTLKETLLNYKNEITKYTDFRNSWFVFGGSRFLPDSNVRRWKKNYFKLANLEEITLHEFRHSHVSLLINEYVKSGQTDTTKFFLMMSGRMGHSVEVMTRVYLHLFPTMQNEIVDLLDNL